MKINEVVCALERFAPLPLQESYDNAGLQIGLTEAEVSGALLCLDVTEAVVDEAVRKGCNLIVSHHPLIFRKLAHITDATYVERCVRKAIKEDIAIVSMHTNMDAALGGVNHKMAEKLGLEDVEFMGSTQEVCGVTGGIGVVGNLPQSVSAENFLKKVKETFNTKVIMTNELLQRPIKRVALCGGAGSFVLSDAIKTGADAFITGEVHYHDYFGTEQVIQMAVIGHYESEQFTNEVFREIIEKECTGVRCVMSEINTNPVRIMY